MDAGRRLFAIMLILAVATVFAVELLAQPGFSYLCNCVGSCCQPVACYAGGGCRCCEEDDGCCQCEYCGEDDDEEESEPNPCAGVACNDPGVACKSETATCSSGNCPYGNKPNGLPDNDSPYLWNDVATKVCCGGTPVNCNNPPVCKVWPVVAESKCTGTSCNYVNMEDGSKDNSTPNLCNSPGQMCCSGMCRENHCFDTSECTALNPSANAGEQSAISPLNPAIECIYSSTNPRAYQHNCANSGTCTSSCSKTELGKAGFCQYCPYTFRGIFFPEPTNTANFTSMTGRNVEFKAYLPTGELAYSKSYTATEEYTTFEQDTSCTRVPKDFVVSVSGGMIEMSFGEVIIENYPRQTIANFTKFYVPKIPQDPREDSPNGITKTLSEQRNASAIEAIDVKIDQTNVKLSGQNPTAPLRFLYYNITMIYTNDQVPNPMVEGNKEKFLDSLDLYKCDHQFFIGSNTCTGNNWKNTTELPGVLLQKALTPTGGIVIGSNYTSFSGIALGGAISNNGADCVRDSDCTTGCCGSPTWEGRRYCTDCLPPDCDEGFCECTGFASPICIVEPPTTIVGGTTTTVPIGCLTDNDCTGCHFCANATIDPLTNPWGVNQCLACSTTQDGICQSSHCIGCDPDCCSDNCDHLGSDPPYYCANTTLDGTALEVGVCTACDTTGNSDNWVPDPVCAGLDNDFCNSTIECTDANTYCQCTDDECFFGICMAKRGNFCETDNDCTANTYCSRTAHICASNCFVSIAPQQITTKLGNMKIMKVVVADPIGKDATYKLKIVDSGTYASGAPFASFLDGKKTFVVNVPRNGRKEVPVQFRAAAIGKYSLLISASSTEFSGGAREGVNSDQCALNAASAEIKVESEVSSAGQFLSAPGIGVAEIGAIVALAGVFFILVDRRK